MPTKKLRSEITREGLHRTPHRAFMRAMGLDDAAIARPMIGVVSMKGEQTPCNMTHGFQVDAAKEGIAEAGGTPREFTTISVSDGISMNHEGMKFSLVSRELIADSIEAVVHGLAYDGLVGFGGCDKTLPGVLMGMVRCNVPSVFLYGGAALPGHFDGKDVTILDSYEAVGAVLTGDMDEATLARLERACLPTVGACAGQFTANTMAMVSEALGMSAPNVSMIPGVYSERAGHARRAGDIVMRAVLGDGPRPRDIVTRSALENACAIVAATGGSTNAALHISAIAHEAGIAFDMDDVAAVFARTPLIADLRPGGRFTARDVHEIGGAAVIIRALIELGAIDGSCLTVTGETLTQVYGAAAAPDGAVVRAQGSQIAPDGGVAVLKGNLCPDGALIKVAGLKTLVHEGPARVFESEGECARAVEARAYQAGDVLIIRNEGPVGGPGMQEMLGVTALVRKPLPPPKVCAPPSNGRYRRRLIPVRKFTGLKGRTGMDEYQLGWQDPIDQLDALRVAVKHLRARGRIGPRDRFERATAPLTKYWRMPERLKNRRDNILNARRAVRRDGPAGTLFRFDLLGKGELRALADDIFALYEACLLDIGRMYAMGGAAAGWYDIMYPNDAAPRVFKPRSDPLDNLLPFTGLRVIDDADEI